MKSSLTEANDIINGERQDQYGNPEDSFEIIADFWDSYLSSKYGDQEDFEIDSIDVAHMMTLFKIARMLGQKPTRDSYIDAIGYLAIAADRLLEEETDDGHPLDIFVPEENILGPQKRRQ